MITRRELSRIDAASSAVAECTGLAEPCAVVLTCACPNAPNRTFVKERFIALHMITDRMKPEDAFSAPAMINRRLPRANPMAVAAAPAEEINHAQPVGMVAPPHGQENPPTNADANTRENGADP